MPYYIAFDCSHKERARIDENYEELRDYLMTNELICYNFLETPITEESLKPYDILVIACPDFSKFSSLEIIEIANWVKVDGGGLLLLSHAGGDKGRNSNLSELSEQFGIKFENDQVLDENNNIGIENMPIISSNNFIPPHPITTGISSICYRAGCSLLLVGSAISIVSSNETSEPLQTPIICTSEFEKGRICAIGSYEMFRDKIGGGFQYVGHSTLALNIFKWLITDYRMEVTKQGIEHKIPLMKKSLQLADTETDKIEMLSDKIEMSLGKEDLTIKFNTKEELFTILKTYLNQINSMKNNIEKLMGMLSQSTEEIFQKMDVKKHKADVAINPDYIYEPYSEADEIKSEKIQKDKEEITLTALPPKPGDLKQKESEDKGFINPVPKPPTIISKQPKLQKITNIPTKTAEIKKDKEKTQADLKAELENVEGKLSSITNLINFIEKKHDGGKLDDKNYKRQIKKLQNDLDQSKKRIEEIKNELK
jgi:hypothetical protein